MKVAILAGGYGSRLAEETEIRPKPMVEIGGKPILWHIMSHYAHYGHKDFAVALGYKGEYIKKYFSDFCKLQGNLTVDLKRGEVTSDTTEEMDWVLRLVDTGLKTMTGGRVKRLADVLGNETFMLTWGTASPTSTWTPCSPSTARTASSPRSPRCAPRLATA